MTGSEIVMLYGLSAVIFGVAIGYCYAVVKGWVKAEHDFWPDVH